MVHIAESRILIEISQTLHDWQSISLDSLRASAKHCFPSYLIPLVAGILDLARNRNGVFVAFIGWMLSYYYLIIYLITRSIPFECGFPTHACPFCCYVPGLDVGNRAELLIYVKGSSKANVLLSNLYAAYHLGTFTHLTDL